VIILLAVALLVLGPKRLPGAGRALGQGIEFRSSINGDHESEPLPRATIATSQDERPVP
jgi:sec-independent protein translocase protein TatA